MPNATEQWQAANEEWNRAEDERDSAQASEARLREAFFGYADHAADCEWAKVGCTCGYDDALAVVENRAARDTGTVCDACDKEQRVGDEGWEASDQGLDYCPDCWRDPAPPSPDRQARGDRLADLIYGAMPLNESSVDEETEAARAMQEARAIAGEALERAKAWHRAAPSSPARGDCSYCDVLEMTGPDRRVAS